MTTEEIKQAIECLKWQLELDQPIEREKSYSIAIQALQKEIPYTCKVEDNKFGYHKCKCGVYFVDKHFDGYCGRCGQKIKW